jgi:hypothetical protein
MRREKASANAPTANVHVRLGEKGTVITGMVRDARTGEKLPAMFEFYPTKFPNQGGSMSSGADYRIFIAPSTDYSLKISAPGYKSWSYASHHIWHRSLRLAPHAHLYLNVKLRPIHRFCGRLCTKSATPPKLFGIDSTPRRRL